jgi:hypothetical protein
VPKVFSGSCTERPRARTSPLHLLGMHHLGRGPADWPASVSAALSCLTAASAEGGARSSHSLLSHRDHVLISATECGGHLSAAMDRHTEGQEGDPAGGWQAEAQPICPPRETARLPHPSQGLFSDRNPKSNPDRLRRPGTFPTT